MTDAPDDAPPAQADARRLMAERRMLESLVCPVTQGRLEWDRNAQELISRAARLAFPVRDGIPVMLLDEVDKLGRCRLHPERELVGGYPRRDLWVVDLLKTMCVEFTQYVETLTLHDC